MSDVATRAAMLKLVAESQNICTQGRLEKKYFSIVSSYWCGYFEVCRNEPLVFANVRSNQGAEIERESKGEGRSTKCLVGKMVCKQCVVAFLGIGTS